MAAQAEEIKGILQKYPQETIIGEYICEHPEGVILLGNHHLWFHSREPGVSKRVIEVELGSIHHINYQPKEQSLRIEMKGITHFFHSIVHCSELYNVIVGKKQSWYSEYNALMHTHFKLPVTESLIECVHATITSATTRNRPGTLYISQNYVGYTLKLSDETKAFPINSIRTASKENSLLTAKGIKVVAASGEYYFSGFITRRTHVLEILLDLMTISKQRAGKQQRVDQASNSSGQVPISASDSDIELEQIEQDFTALSKTDSVKHEAEREAKVLHDAVEASTRLDEDMTFFLVAAESNQYKSSLTDAIPVVETIQHTMNAIREAGLRLLVDIMEGRASLPAVIPPEGTWDNDTQMLAEMAQKTGTRLISQTITIEDTLTPISGGLYTIAKTLLQCFLRVRKHFNTLHEYVTGKKHHLVPSLTLKKPVNKLKLYNEQMNLLVTIVPLIVSIAMKPDFERFTAFKVDELLERIKVKSFWYEYQGSLKTFVKLLNSVTAALSKSYQYESGLVRYPVAFMVGAAYAFDSEGAEKRVEELGKNLDPKLAKLIWNLPDKPFIRFFDHLTIASVAVSHNFNITPDEPGALPIHCKIISAKHPPIDVHRLGKPPVINQPHHHASSFDLAQLPVILHFHGGGFVSMSPESHEVYLREWARVTQAIIISVDYKQAPEYKFPIALNECFNVYKWLVEGNLGFIPRKITLVGDSAGGNLVASTTLKAIATGIRVPESAVLIYPALNLVKMATPSRIINMNDPIVSFGFLQMCLDSYLPADCNPWDMFISPLYAHEKYLRAFPTTYIMGMAFDPLLDDYVAFTKRLKALGKNVFFKLYEDLPHGVLNMVKMIPAAKKAIDDSGLWLRWSIS